MPTTPYSYATLSFVETELARRLYDPSMIFWSQAELLVYIQEALMTWNALTAYWRYDFTFPSVASQTFYDLTTVPNTLRPLTVTDASLYETIEYYLLEPATGINPYPPTASSQFTADDLLNAVQRRRDELLSITGCTVNRRLVSAVAGRITLPDTVIDIRRIAYLPSLAGQSPSVLWPDDAWSEQSFNVDYTLTPAGTPLTYLQSVQPPISFDTDVPPAYSGSYEVLTIEAGPALSATSPSTLLVPDDWTHVIKWGALADLLSRESDARDIPRAAYCEQRYRLGAAALSVAPALLALRINNIPVQIDSVRAADLYATAWQAATSGTPKNAYYAGLNLLALAPQPSSTAFSQTASVVQNAPLPSAPNDPVQVAREDLDAILDYAQHLAAFKQGGQEFAATTALFQRFLKAASLYNSKLLQLGEFTTMLTGLAARERDMHPITQPTTGAA
jgi:hypothetical protein